MSQRNSKPNSSSSSSSSSKSTRRSGGGSSGKSKSTRRNHSAAFKARIAREALRGVKTISEIAAENDLHPMQVTQWKKQLEEASVEVFDKPRGRKPKVDENERKLERLERKVGQLVLERDWLEKKCKELGIDP
jgi:transposase-like protein